MYNEKNKDSKDNIKDSDNIDKKRESVKRELSNIELSMIFGALYATGVDPNVILSNTNCKNTGTQKHLLERYIALNLPAPQIADEALLSQLEQSLPVSELVQILAKSARDNVNNTIADKVLQLYLERERTRKREKYNQMDVQQRFAQAMKDTDFMAAIERAIAAEHIGERLLHNPAYWRAIVKKLGKEPVLEVKALIDKALVIPDNVDKRELA